MTARKPLQALWEYIRTIVTAIAYTSVGLGVIVLFGMLLALPIVVIVWILQHLF